MIRAVLVVQKLNDLVDPLFKRQTGDLVGPGDSTNVVIADPETPLASIPKMGDAGISGYAFGASLALLAAGGAVYLRKRLARS